MANTSSRAPLWENSRALHIELVADGWRTPDTYSAYFESLIEGPAVYLFRACDIFDCNRAFVAYVGMATNLRNRLNGHEVLAKVRATGFYAQRWFKPIPSEKLREVERQFIERFDPPWNLIGRKKGVAIS